MRIWMHTIGYPPKRVGGTEIHVKDLAEELSRRGHEVHVSYDSDKRSTTLADRGILLHEGLDLKELEEIRPDMVHLHPLYAHEVTGIVEFVSGKYPLVTTYHTPTISCVRGSHLYMGDQPCDGLLRQRRCCACLFRSRGLSGPASLFASFLPMSSYRMAARFSKGRLASMAGWPARIERQRKAFHRLCSASHRLIAVCEWMREVMVLNGIDGDKISIVRYGRNVETVKSPHEYNGTLKLGYLGRLTREKGIDVLLKAVEMLPSTVTFTVEFVSPAFGGKDIVVGDEEKKYADIVRNKAENDKRIIIRGAVASKDSGKVLSGWDALIVPSLWMECGPQVVTESFISGTPVIGSRRGGIRELVKAGVNGVLFDTGDAGSLARIIEELADKPEKINDLRRNIGKVNTVSDMTDEVEKVYEKARI